MSVSYLFPVPCSLFPVPCSLFPVPFFCKSGLTKSILSITELIANWRIITIKQTNLIEEDQEIVMNLSTAYVEWEQKTLEQGRQEGEQRGEKRLIIRQINKKFDVIPDALIEQIHQLSIEQLELLGEAFLDFSTMTDLEQWLENRR